MSQVALKNLDISFAAIKVIENLSLTIKEGEFIVLLGPSGCGKSTLLNAIGGLVDVSGGTIYFNQQDVTDFDPKDRGIGMVFQSYALYPTMSVWKNMAFGLQVSGYPKHLIEEKIKWAAKLLKLEDLLDRKPAHLSGGQRQRVAIGRALVREAKVYLFDEPLSNLDAKLRAGLRLEIKKLHKTIGATMIYVTHDQIEALTLADRVAVMKDGFLQQFAPPQDVYNMPANLFVASFVGSPEMNFIQGYYHKATQQFRSGKFHLNIASYPFQNDVQEGAKLTLGLRPEHINLHAKAPYKVDQGSLFKGQTRLIEPMGSACLVWGELGEHSVSILADAELVTTLEQQFFGEIRLDKISLFCTLEGHRL